MPQMTIPYLLERAARRHPDKEAVVWEDGRWTYAQWRDQVRRIARALAGLGLHPGQRVATLFTNGPGALGVYLALLRLGAVIVPLNMRHSPDEMAYVVGDSQARWCCCEGPLRPLLEGLRPLAGGVQRWLVWGGQPGDGEEELRAAAEAGGGTPPAGGIGQDQTACLLYTAGTTGRPKGVPLSHLNLIWSAINASAVTEVGPEQRGALVFPLFHVAAFGLLVLYLYVGCTIVTFARFDPRQVMERVQSEGITRLVFPPTVWNFILQLPGLGNYDTSSVRLLGSGAETMPVASKLRLLEVFPRAKLGDTYGMTETAATISYLAPADMLRKTASVGKPFYNVEVRISDPQGRDLPPGQVGEIWVRGPNLTTGYHHQPQANGEAFRDGWFRTADLGEFDDEGFLYLRERQKDLIISGGENIYPKEVEEVLYSHPAVAEAAVVGLADPTWGQRVHAVVVPKAGCRLGEEEVIAYCKERLASFKKPKSVEFVESLPRTPSGKVLKRLLRGEGQA